MLMGKPGQKKGIFLTWSHPQKKWGMSPQYLPIISSDLLHNPVIDAIAVGHSIRKIAEKQWN